VSRKIREIAPAAIDPEELLLAYRLGIFPMAERRDAPDVLWVRPHERGILPLEKFHVPKRLARIIRADRYEVRIDSAFGDVIRACAETRDETWINAAIVTVFEALHARRLAHSVEAWHEGRLVGGVYGLALGGAFFAESKFSRMNDASKVVLVHLAARLKQGGYRLLDAQFPNPHLEQFGAIAVPEERFQHLLTAALAVQGNFYGLGNPGGAVGEGPMVGGGPGGGSSAGGLAGMAEGGPAGVPASGRGGATGWSVLQVMTQTS
jgi:leucyl/phenylalanyl-tRNA--protein transferase